MMTEPSKLLNFSEAIHELVAITITIDNAQDVARILRAEADLAEAEADLAKQADDIVVNDPSP
jgi:hypothetical protein